MKKFVRMVAISALSGLAFLTACFGSRGLSRAERKRLLAERESVEKTLAEIPMAGTSSREFVEVQSLRYSLMNKLDSINFRLGEDVDLAGNVRRRELQLRNDSVYFDRQLRRVALEQRLESLRNIINERDGSRVYGSPEVIDAYRRETEHLRQEADSIEDELNGLKALERKEIEEQIKKLPVRKTEGRAADVLYGSPTPRSMK